MRMQRDHFSTRRECSRRRLGGFTLIHLLIVLALLALIAAFLIPWIQRMRTEQKLALCKDHLRQIGVGLIQYAHENGGALPVGNSVDGSQQELLRGLSAGHSVGDSGIYYCPALEDSGASFSEVNFKAARIGYFYYSALGADDNPKLSKFLRTGLAWPRKLDTSMDPKSWVMSDIWISAVPTAHVGFRKGVNYLMLDGSVGFVSGSPREAFH